MSSLLICETCRFMAAERRNFGFAPKHRTCTRVIHGNGDAEYNEGTPKEPALVVDGSGYAARLIVLPNFGCVLHEQKQ